MLEALHIYSSFSFQVEAMSAPCRQIWRLFFTNMY